MLNKEAKISLLKSLGIGAGALASATGIGAASYGVGKKKGATETATAMSSAFKELNARENAAIRSSFNRYNEKENKALASHYFRKGVALGAGYSGGQSKSASLILDNIYEKSFKDELNNISNG